MEDCQILFRAAYAARTSMALLDEASVNNVLEAVAVETEAKMHHILSENQKDVQRMDKNDPMYDRLLLTEQRIAGIVADIRNVAGLASPTGRILRESVHRNGMRMRKTAVPFGVIGMIYEARPNVSFDVFSLCLKTRNVCLLKGSSNARFSNEAIVNLIRDVLDSHNIDPNICTLMPSERDATAELLKAVEYVDLVIPRGGKALIDFVRRTSLVPVIETGAGVCHTYFNKSGDREIGRNIIFNAKTRRVSVCNALDCLIIDKERLNDLSWLCEPLQEKNVVIYADKQAYEALSGAYPRSLLKQAGEEAFGTEFLDYKMAVKTVSGIREALKHIEKFGSKHSESIVSADEQAVKLFEQLVDASSVYANVSTAFTDGAQFGLGAEIGISTQKMHARGPMGMEELCTCKWIIEGEGQVRE